MLKGKGLSDELVTEGVEVEVGRALGEAVANLQTRLPGVAIIVGIGAFSRAVRHGDGVDQRLLRYRHIRRGAERGLIGDFRIVFLDRRRGFGVESIGFR